MFSSSTSTTITLDQLLPLVSMQLANDTGALLAANSTVLTFVALNLTSVNLDNTSQVIAAFINTHYSYQWLKYDLSNSILFFLYWIIIVVAIVGNSSILFVVAVRRRLWTPSVLLSSNLLSASLLSALLCMPLTLQSFVFREWTLGWFCCKILPFFQSICVFVSSFTVVAIAADRYFRIKWLCPINTSMYQTSSAPHLCWTNVRHHLCSCLYQMCFQALIRRFKYYLITPSRSASSQIVYSGCIWLVSAVFSSPIIYFQDLTTVGIVQVFTYNACIERLPDDVRIIYTLYTFALAFVFPMCALFYFHMSIRRYLNHNLFKNHLILSSSLQHLPGKPSRLPRPPTLANSCTCLHKPFHMQSNLLSTARLHGLKFRSIYCNQLETASSNVLPLSISLINSIDQWTDDRPAMRPPIAHCDASLMSSDCVNCAQIVPKMHSFDQLVDLCPSTHAPSTNPTRDSIEMSCLQSSSMDRDLGHARTATHLSTPACLNCHDRLTCRSISNPPSSSVFFDNHQCIIQMTLCTPNRTQRASKWSDPPSSGSGTGVRRSASDSFLTISPVHKPSKCNSIHTINNALNVSTTGPITIVIDSKRSPCDHPRRAAGAATVASVDGPGKRPLAIDHRHKMHVNRMASIQNSHPITSGPSLRPAKYVTCYKRAQRLQRELQRNSKVTFVLMMSTVVFSISWLPLSLYNLYLDLNHEQITMSVQLFYVILFACHLLAMSSSLSNAILYGFLNTNIQRELRQMLNTAKRKFNVHFSINS